MRELAESLSWSTGFIVVAVVSAVASMFFAQLSNPLLRWVSAVCFSYLSAHALYWLPVWLGANSAEYSAWAFAFVLPWFLASTLVSVVVLLLLRNRYNSKRGHHA